MQSNLLATSDRLWIMDGAEKTQRTPLIHGHGS